MVAATDCCTRPSASKVRATPGVAVSAAKTTTETATQAAVTHIDDLGEVVFWFISGLFLEVAHRRAL